MFWLIQSCITKLCSEPGQASKMNLFAKIVNAKEFGDSSNRIDLWMPKKFLSFHELMIFMCYEYKFKNNWCNDLLFSLIDNWKILLYRHVIWILIDVVQQLKWRRKYICSNRQKKFYTVSVFNDTIGSFIGERAYPDMYSFTIFKKVTILL